MEVDGLATQRAMDELGLPEALLMPLEEEEAPTTFLQASIWAEGRTGTNLLVQVEKNPIYFIRSRRDPSAVNVLELR